MTLSLWTLCPLPPSGSTQHARKPNTQSMCNKQWQRLTALALGIGPSHVPGTILAVLQEDPAEAGAL